LLAWTLAPLTARAVVSAGFSLLLVFSSYYAVSRRFESEADRNAALVAGNPEAATRALAALYSKTRRPLGGKDFWCSAETHPGFLDRIEPSPDRLRFRVVA